MNGAGGGGALKVHQDVLNKQNEQISVSVHALIIA